MKILLISTLKRNVTASNFASRSRIIYQLAEGLVKQGHQVSLLGTGDSSIPGVINIPVTEKGWVDSPTVENEFLRDTATLMQQTQKIVEIQDEFDVIHNHTYPDFFPLIAEDKIKTPFLTTFHAVYDYYLDEILAQFNKTHFVALSKKYQSLFKKGKIKFVVYNGVDTDLYTFSDKKEDYLFWLGRLPKGKNKDGSFIDPKGVRSAIELAQKTNSKLLLTGSVEDIEFYEKDVKPHLNDKIQWIGDVSKKQSVPTEKIVSLFKHAKTFLMTINQHENFGLVMAEAMSCGTPVIGFERGSVSELIVEGKTGFVVPYEDGVDGLQEALSKIDTIKPEDCREHILENFSINKMVANYESVYKKISSRLV